MLVFRLSPFSSAFSSQTSPPSGLLSPCPWTGRAVWHASCEHIKTRWRRTLEWINSLSCSSVNLYDDRTLLVPAVELVLLQRDVGVRIQLPLFLHISFSFLWDERIRCSDLQFLTSNSCSVSACWQTHLWLVLCPHVIPSSKRSVDTWASSWGERNMCFLSSNSSGNIVLSSQVTTPEPGQMFT